MTGKQMTEKQMMENERDVRKSPTLTINDDGKRYDFSFMEPSLEPEGDESVTKSVSVGTVDESMLTEEEKKKVEEFVKQIDIKNIQMVNAYGSSAQNGISTFSEAITKNVKPKEFGDIGNNLLELQSAINSTMSLPKKGILGLFQKGKQKIKHIISNYENAENSIKRIEKDLKTHQQILTKDIYIFEQMYDMNIEFYKELTMYIIAGKKALNNAKETTLVEFRNKAEITNDQLVVQMYRDYNDVCNRFEKRIYDLEMTRLVSIQMAPQIRQLQNNNQQLVDKLRSNIINTIPLWRNQMVLALGLEHTDRALSAQKSLDEMTNQMFIYNADRLKQGAIDAALASERGIVDVETLRKVNADIITSINEVIKIHEEGSKRRAEAQEEFVKIEEELKHALLNAGN